MLGADDAHNEHPAYMLFDVSGVDGDRVELDVTLSFAWLDGSIDRVLSRAGIVDLSGLWLSMRPTAADLSYTR